MRENSSSTLGPPPEVMTWGKAVPVFVLALLFDALRFMCNQFWFFGPALLAIVCTTAVEGTLASWTLGLLGTKTAALVCGSAAVAVGFYGLPAMGTLGFVLAMSVGLLGWLVIGLYIILTNRRLFSENATSIAWFAGSLLVSEVPFVGALPAFTGTLWRLYHAQIKKEKAQLQAYEEKREKLHQEERQRQLIRAQQAYQATQAANDAQYQEEARAAFEAQETEAANDASYQGIPEPVRKAA